LAKEGEFLLEGGQVFLPPPTQQLPHQVLVLGLERADAVVGFDQQFAGVGVVADAVVAGEAGTLLGNDLHGNSALQH
jgi:hypothetical protein